VYGGDESCKIVFLGGTSYSRVQTSDTSYLVNYYSSSSRLVV